MSTKPQRRHAIAMVVAATTVVLTIATIGAAPAGARPKSDLVVNGSFEVPDVPTGTFALLGNVPGWTSLGPWIEIQDHVAGDPAPGAGEQFAELDTEGFYQDIATISGQTYELTFLYSARPNTLSDENFFRVTAGDESAVLAPVPGSSTNWQSYTLRFVATDSTTRIQFEDLGTGPAAGLGAYIDQVSVVACRPGHGHGDRNHCHSGPPGKR